MDRDKLNRIVYTYDTDHIISDKILSAQLLIFAVISRIASQTTILSTL
jgi:hypothetical protein